MKLFCMGLLGWAGVTFATNLMPPAEPVDIAPRVRPIYLGPNVGTGAPAALVVLPLLRG